MIWVGPYAPELKLSPLLSMAGTVHLDDASRLTVAVAGYASPHSSYLQPSLGPAAIGTRGSLIRNE